jgi:drug/metabolite transporter (DMT)-like permease
MNFALVMLDASVWQMMRASSIIFVTLFSVILLKRKLYRHHITGIACIVVGLTLVALSRIITNSNIKQNKPLGFLTVLLSQVFISGVYISEEKIMKAYYIAPVQVVGLEGLSGVTICITIVLPILTSIACPAAMINTDSCPFGTLESVSFAIEQICQSWKLILAILGYIFSIALFNFFGISITNFASALSRSTIEVIRNCTIWIFSLLFGWEKLRWMSFLQLGGFITLTFGSLLFNEIIILPIMGFNLYTKNAIAQREKAKNLL